MYISAVGSPVVESITGSLASCGQHVALAGDLGLDLGHRGVGIVVQLHVGLDGRDPLGAAREQIVDAVGLGHGLLQRRGDEALDQLAAGAGVGGGDRYHRVLGLGVLAQIQVRRSSAGRSPGSAG